MALNLTGRRRLNTAPGVMSAITSGDCRAVRAPGRAGRVRRGALEPTWRRAPAPFPVVGPAPASGGARPPPQAASGSSTSRPARRSSRTTCSGRCPKPSPLAISACFVARSTTRHVRGEKTPWREETRSGSSPSLTEHDLHRIRERGRVDRALSPASSVLWRCHRHQAQLSHQALFEARHVGVLDRDPQAGLFLTNLSRDRRQHLGEQAELDARVVRSETPERTRPATRSGTSYRRRSAEWSPHRA